MRNIEVKTRVPDWERLGRELARAGARDDGVETQQDIFYACRSGRLKLRLSSRSGAMLIHYVRADAARVRASDYDLAPVVDGDALRRVLDAGLERLGVVRKTRHLYWIDNVRVHLDEVEGLGRFLELEAIVDQAHPEASCRRHTEELLQAFGIRPADHLRHAYGDLLRGGSEA